MFKVFKNGKTILKDGFTVFLCLWLCVSMVHAWPRLGAGSKPVFQNSGDTTQNFSVSITSGNARLVYSGYDPDRQVYLQNTSTYTVYCGTGSYVKDQIGFPRFNIAKSSEMFITTASYDIWCVGENSLGNRSIEILGSVFYDKKDN